MANRVDPDQMPHSSVSDLDLHCLQRPICPNTLGYYGNWQFISQNFVMFVCFQLFYECFHLLAYFVIFSVLYLTGRQRDKYQTK